MNLEIKHERPKVLFVVQASAYPQMGVLYLVDSLRQVGFDSQIVSSDIDTLELDEIIQTENPVVVGMSVLTAPQVIDFERLSMFVKTEFPHIKVISNLSYSYPNPFI